MPPDPDVARAAILDALGTVPAGLEVRPGRMSVELRPVGLGDKGSAARADHRSVRPSRGGGRWATTSPTSTCSTPSPSCARRRPAAGRDHRRRRSRSRRAARRRRGGRRGRRRRPAEAALLLAELAERSPDAVNRIRSARSSSWRRSHHVMSSASTPRRRRASRFRRSSGCHSRAVASASAVPTTSAGATASAPVGHLVEGAGGLRQDQHRVAVARR